MRLDNKCKGCYNQIIRLLNYLKPCLDNKLQSVDSSNKTIENEASKIESRVFRLEQKIELV
jgi:hypothetical protein